MILCILSQCIIILRYHRMGYNMTKHLNHRLIQSSCSALIGHDLISILTRAALYVQTSQECVWNMSPRVVSFGPPCIPGGSRNSPLSGWRDQDSQSRAKVSWTPGSMLVWSECRRVLAAWPGLRAGAGVPALGLSSSFPFPQVPREPAGSPLAGSFKLSQLLSREPI